MYDISIIIERASVWSCTDQPITESVYNQEHKVWLATIPLQQILETYGKCVITYIAELPAYKVIIYDYYLE